MAEADRRETFNVHDAKTHLSRLIERAHGGEEIVLAKAGVPYAKLGPLDAVGHQAPRMPGRFKGEFDRVPDSLWFEPFYAEKELESFLCETGDEPATA